MPRKRTTRTQTTHAKPRLELGDEQIVNGLTLAEKKTKIANLIKDFDYNVENVCKQYEEEYEALEKEIQKQFHHIRCQLSPIDLKMTVEQYVDFKQSELDEEMKTVSMPTSRTIGNIPSSLKNIKTTLSKYHSRQMIETIPEEGVTGEPQTATRRSPRKRGARNKAQGVTFNAQPPLSASSVQNSFVTPALQRNVGTTGWGATPLITPKFDPRLPITPANSRRVRPGEVAMSLAGSPLNMDSDNRSKTLVLHNGEEIDFEIPDRSSINSLMSTLKNIMKKGQDMHT